MNDDKVFYITTPIYYVNDIPHIGHAYTTIACDAVSRYKRMKGYDVHFLTGTDEHGQKIQTAAEAKGKTPQQLVDEIHLNFKRLWEVLNISNDDFIRTTEPRHIKVVQAMFKKLMDQGDIYKGTYTGYYCVPCETYVPENAMGPNKTCPDCGRPLTIMEEESYFFRGSKYVPELIKFYEEHVKAVMPKIRYNEIMSFLKGGVKDQSVSRTSIKWGIPVPGDEKHVIYVWFDALINYAAAVGYLDDPEKFAHYWPHVRHMVGKDIIRFHCVIWPLMLLALGINLPVEVIAHGWWTYNGEKMSKSKGNVVDPFKMVEEYGLDPFRYFLLREVPFGNDGDFSELALIGRINSDLANDLGNLLNRTLQMIKSYRDGVVPDCVNAESELSSMAFNVLDRVDEAMNNFAFDEALKAIWEFIGRANKFIDETTPWKLAKDETQAERLNFVLLNLYEALCFSALLIAPTMPDTAKKIWLQLGLEGEPVKMLYDEFVWGDGANATINKAEVLFPRIDINEWKKTQEEKKKMSEEIKEPAIEHEAEISIDDFKTVEMRVAKIINVEEIPRSKKLYKLEVDLGYEKRTVCSGIKAFFTPEELNGKTVILVTNLKPVKLCGVESNGMILAASVKKDGVSEQLTLLTPEKDIPLGSRVS
ncbi:MAG: methionine--tRNA ligase [Synergistales bacterium]|nr:methionine--tRNA ligase [Synergistales bacterium]MDY6402082.1 methionine--tRNA ligase [Synergistales bacterium]MDY6405257.1 methionine--tRNA ligase [Synergistales bacterium]MDY6410955.1 methionine--tRNA ligase [Synergistales bacterium]MDY6413858.1 methionine--tRNA ligase [Synergistales bacterium]